MCLLTRTSMSQNRLQKFSAMVRCPRCCLYSSIKLVNLIMLLFGITLIIYSLWLNKKWHQYFSDLHPPPRPWFIYTCSGVGIAVFLSTLSCYVAFNSLSNYTICAYILISCCLLFLEVAIIVIIFFKLDLVAQIASIIDEFHKKLGSFLRFHLRMSRLIVLLISAAQMNAVALSVILWAVGMEPRTDCNQSNSSSFTQSFLVPEPDNSIPSFTRCELTEQEDLLPYCIRLIKDRFQRRNHAPSD